MLVVRGNWPQELPVVRALPLLDSPKSRVTALCLTPLGGNDRLLARARPTPPLRRPVPPYARAVPPRPPVV